MAMRTTLNFTDDAIEMVKSFATARSISAGEAASILVERGYKQSTPVRRDGSFYVFYPGDDASVVTLEHALKIEDESE